MADFISLACHFSFADSSFDLGSSLSSSFIDRSRSLSKLPVVVFDFILGLEISICVDNGAHPEEYEEGENFLK